MKGYLLQCKRPSLTMQKVLFHDAICHLSARRTYLSDFQVFKEHTAAGMKTKEKAARRAGKHG